MATKTNTKLYNLPKDSVVTIGASSVTVLDDGIATFSLDEGTVQAKVTYLGVDYTISLVVPKSIPDQVQESINAQGLLTVAQKDAMVATAVATAKEGLYDQASVDAAVAKAVADSKEYIDITYLATDRKHIKYIVDTTKTKAGWKLKAYYSDGTDEILNIVDNTEQELLRAPKALTNIEVLNTNNKVQDFIDLDFSNTPQGVLLYTVSGDGKTVTLEYPAVGSYKGNEQGHLVSGSLSHITADKVITRLEGATPLKLFNIYDKQVAEIPRYYPKPDIRVLVSTIYENADGTHRIVFSTRESSQGQSLTFKYTDINGNGFTITDITDSVGGITFNIPSDWNKMSYTLNIPNAGASDTLIYSYNKA